jgi:hypothetical protein
MNKKTEASTSYKLTQITNDQFVPSLTEMPSSARSAAGKNWIEYVSSYNGKNVYVRLFHGETDKRPNEWILKHVEGINSIIGFGYLYLEDRTELYIVREKTESISLRKFIMQTNYRPIPASISARKIMKKDDYRLMSLSEMILIAFNFTKEVKNFYEICPNAELKTRSSLNVYIDKNFEISLEHPVLSEYDDTDYENIQPINGLEINYTLRPEYFVEDVKEKTKINYALCSERLRKEKFEDLKMDHQAASKYCIGNILSELLTTSLPFVEEDYILLENVYNNGSRPIIRPFVHHLHDLNLEKEKRENIVRDIIDLIYDLWNHVPSRRPSFDDILIRLHEIHKKML